MDASQIRSAEPRWELQLCFLIYASDSLSLLQPRLAPAYLPPSPVTPPSPTHQTFSNTVDPRRIPRTDGTTPFYTGGLSIPGICYLRGSRNQSPAVTRLLYTCPLPRCAPPHSQIHKRTASGFPPPFLICKCLMIAGCVSTAVPQCSIQKSHY